MSAIQIHSLDVLAFLLYIIVIIVVGIHVSRQKKTKADDYFLAGRSLPWYIVGSSYIAANISTEHFIGLVGAAFIYGICVATGEWSSVIAFTFLIWLYIPFLMKSRVYTAPEFLERRFNRTMRVYFTIVTLILNVFGFLGPILYGGGLVLDALFGLNINLAIIIIALSSGFWAIWGGLRTIASLDIITIFIMGFGGLSVTLTGLNYLGDGAGIIVGLQKMLISNQGLPQFAGDFIRETVPHILKGDKVETPYARLSVIQPLNHSTVPWTHWILSFFYIGLWYTVINQHMIQKVLAARDIYHARMGMVLASALKLFLPVIVVFPGLIFFAMNPLIPEQLNPNPEQVALIEELGLTDELKQKSHILNPSDAALIVEMREGPEVVYAAHQARAGQLSEATASEALENLSKLRFDFASKWSNKSYLQLVSDVMPPFWVGLIMAALFASIQSSVSSVINSSSTVFTMDVYRLFIRPQAGELQDVRVGRITGTAVLALSSIFAVFLAEFSRINLFVFVQTLFVFFAPPFSAVFLVGSLWRRVRGKDAVVASCLAFAFAVVLKIFEFAFPEFLPGFMFPFANQGAAVWFVTLIVIIISALITKPASSKQTGEGLVVRFRKSDFVDISNSRPMLQSIFFWWMVCIGALFVTIGILSLSF